MHLRMLISICAIVSLPQTVVAQGHASETEPIVVTGERQASTDAVREGVDRILPPYEPTDPMARFVDPICLGFAGLNAVQEASFRTMIRFRGTNAGVSLAPLNCTTNALVVVVVNPAAFVAGLREKQPRLLTVRNYRRFKSAMERGDPVFAFTAQEVRTALGRPAPHSAAIPGSTLPMSISTKVNTDARSRRVGLEQSAALLNSVVIFDAEQIEGLTLVQLADYAAMRLLAPSKISANWKGDGPASILKLFSKDESAVEEAMTRFDESYLFALYDLPINASPARLKSSVLELYFEQTTP